jgi:hypothetical protein
VARFVPFTVTVTPANGLFVPSVTVPVTDCAIAATEKNKIKDNERSNLPMVGGDANIIFFLIKASRLIK